MFGKRKRVEMVKAPAPMSAGLIISYKCQAACRHCMYACGPKWDAEWISGEDLRTALQRLAKYIQPAPFGAETIGLSHGLHISGGEPFLNFELLLQAFEIAKEYGIPSTFAETNCFWCKDDETTRERMMELRDAGMRGLMISVNPFYLEHVPFERTERGIRIGHQIFDRNLMVYQVEYYRRFFKWNLKDRLPFEEYLEKDKSRDLMRNIEFFVNGRAPFKLKEMLSGLTDPRPAKFFAGQPCSPEFLREWHNHLDNFGNYMPGFCGGISLGDWHELDVLVGEGIDLGKRPVLGFLVNNDFYGLLNFAREREFMEDPDGYFSKCHVCMDVRRHLWKQGGYPELSPDGFYEFLTN